MGHIQQGDTRQYFSKHVPIKDYTGEYANLINQGLQSGVSITQKANESTLASNQVDLSAKFLAENNKINTKYQADPANPQREVEARQAFDLLASQYKVNPLCEKQWNDIKTNVYDKYKTYNAQWVEQQQQTNIQTNLKNGYENLINQISMLGESGASVDQMKLIYANGIEGLKNGATAGLGEVVVENFLKDADHDIMTTYISALALNNPIVANELIQREDVRNDIGRAETIEKLESYIGTSLNNQAKRTAVNELCSALRALNSDEADAIMDGKADLAKVMKFVESHKFTKDTSDMINEKYGIKSKSGDTYYDLQTKSYKKEEKKAKGGEKLTDEAKLLIAQDLEEDLHNLISFDSFPDMKEIKKGKNQKEASDFLVNYMKSAASMQGRIDAAYYAGAIGKDERKRLMNEYIAPVTDYIESAAQNLDEKSIKGLAGPKLGYENIKNAFNTKDLKGKELEEMNKQKLFAQNYYLDELYKVVQKIPNLENIYSIESLPSRQQQEIYKTASENALKRAKRWTNKPELFFAQEYPDIYAQPFKCLNKKDAYEVNKNVAGYLYKKAFEDENGNSKLDLKDFAQNKMAEEINRQAKINRIKAGDTLNVLRENKTTLSAPDPKTRAEFEKAIKDLGLTAKEFYKWAADKGYDSYSGDGVLGFISTGHIQALRDLRSAKALKELK